MSDLAPPLQQALVAVALALGGIEWLVGGSTARALLGFATTPRDLDIEVTTDDVHRAAAALGTTAALAVDDRARSMRAGAEHGGVEIDVSAGLTLVGPGGNLPPDFALMWRFATPLPVAGHTVHVAPVEEQIVRILVSGHEARRARFVAEAPAGFIARDDYVSLRLDAARAAR